MSKINSWDNTRDPLSHLLGEVPKSNTNHSWASNVGTDFIESTIRNAIDACSVQTVTFLDIGEEKDRAIYDKIHNDPDYKLVSKQGKFTVVETKEGKDFSQKDETYKFMIEYVKVDPSKVKEFFEKSEKMNIIPPGAVRSIISRHFPSTEAAYPEWMETLKNKEEKALDEAIARGKKESNKGKKIEEDKKADKKKIKRLSKKPTVGSTDI